MANVAKLKKKAAEFELKRQFDKALAVYVEILDDFDQHPEEVDVALFNRVGDMLLRQGNVADAVDYYERAVDRYAEGGFFNNAIALCNKILRQSPGRSSIYYKLGKISAQKGFKSDAKQNFLEYADRMQKSRADGRGVPRAQGVRRPLPRPGRHPPDAGGAAVAAGPRPARRSTSSRRSYERYSEEGRDVEARATLDRIMAIDPAYKPRETGPQKTQKSSDIVFLDIYSMGDDKPAAKPAPAPACRAARARRRPSEPDPPRTDDDRPDDRPGDATVIGGLETTSLGDSARTWAGACSTSSRRHSGRAPWMPCPRRRSARRTRRSRGDELRLGHGRA